MYINPISILHILHDPTRILLLELRMAMMMISYRLKTLEFPTIVHLRLNAFYNRSYETLSEREPIFSTACVIFLLCLKLFSRLFLAFFFFFLKELEPGTRIPLRVFDLRDISVTGRKQFWIPFMTAQNHFKRLLVVRNRSGENRKVSVEFLQSLFQENYLRCRKLFIYRLKVSLSETMLA